MKSAVLSIAILAASAAGASAAAVPPPSPESHPGASLSVIGTNSEYAEVEIGESAPDFSFESPAGGTMRLRDVRAHGAALVVIGAGDGQLAALERERPRLLALGVVPVAVLDYKPGHCRDLARRLGFQGVVAADPLRVIAAQFNALDPATRASVPAWFVVARDGRVRSFGRLDWPDGAWSELAAGALGLPAGGPNATSATSAP